MNLFKCFMNQSTWAKGAGTHTPKGILWHSTGCNNTTLKRYVQPDDNAPDKQEMLDKIGVNRYKNDWNHIYREAGVNAWIGTLADGSVATCQVGPWDRVAWGVGDKRYAHTLNETHIQFEICEDELNDRAYFEKVYKEAVELTAYLCKLYDLDPYGTFDFYGITVPVICDHKTSHTLKCGGNHGDVGHWFPKYIGNDYLDKIRADVKALLDKDKPQPKPEPKPEPTPQPTDTLKEGDVVEIVGNYYYKSTKKIPAWVKAKKWIVYQVQKNARVVINKSTDGKNAIMSAVDASDLRKVVELHPVAYTTYTVKRGDTLWGIATRLLGKGTRYPEIQALNGMGTSTLIHAGDILKIPKR